MNDDELSPDEREALANLKRDVLPPAGVEAQTIAALRSRGLLRAVSCRCSAGSPLPLFFCARSRPVWRGTEASHGRRRSENRVSCCCSMEGTRSIALTVERNTPAGRVPSRQEASRSQARSCPTPERRSRPERRSVPLPAATSSWPRRTRTRRSGLRRRAPTCDTADGL